MHCKFVFAYCLLFLFVVSSACEFRFIERIGTHDKKRSRFYYYYYYTVYFVLASCTLKFFVSIVIKS